MRPRFGIKLIRLAMVAGALLATLPLTTIAFAWTQPICNPSTGEVLPPSHFADEAAYNKYLKDHPGSFEMQAGDQCVAQASQHGQSAPPAGAAAPASTRDTSTAPLMHASDTPAAPSTPSGTVVCVVSVNDVGTTVEQHRVLDVTRWLGSHPGSFIMASGKDCGATFTPNLPTTTNVPATTASAADVTISAPVTTADTTTASVPGPLTASEAAAPAFAAAPVEVAGVTVASAPVEVAGVTLAAAPVEMAGVAVAGVVLGEQLVLASPAQCAQASDSLEAMTIEAGTMGACGAFGAAELDLAGAFQYPSIPPDAGDGTTADEIVP